MSDVTAVPLRPIPRSVLVKLWLAIVVLLAAAGLFAWMSTARAAAVYGSSEDFLAWNGSRPGVETTPSGLQFMVLEEGDGGEHPGATDAVLISYEGRLPTGEVFDSGERVPLNLGQVVTGFGEGLQMMSRGAKFRLWLPPSLGYGATPPDGSPITDDTVMEFDIELIDFISQANLMQQMQQAPVQGEMPGGPPGAH